MAKYDMCEALYALPNGMIEKRRKSIVTPVAILIVGLVLGIINFLIVGTQDTVNLKSALVLFSASFVMVGGAMLFARVAGHSSAPYHKKDHCYLNRNELKFNKEQKNSVLDLLKKGDFTTLRNFPSDGISALLVVIYTSPKSGFTVAQAFEYIDLELHPISELKIIE
ncbi:MAG: hypothetical protein II299_01695 [Alistipes sp.]|nr:hypothetical protein [Alistipes sp.]